MHILKISALLLVKNNSLLAIVYTCLCTVLQSLFLGLCGVCSCFTMFWLLQERSWNCFFFSISKYSCWNLSTSQTVLEEIPKSTEECHKLQYKFHYLYRQLIFQKVAMHSTTFFNPFSHHSCIKKSHFSEPSDFWFGNIKWLWLLHWRNPLYTIAIFTKTFLDFIMVLILILFDLWLKNIYFFKGEKFPHTLCEWLNAVKIIWCKSYVLAADRRFITFSLCFALQTYLLPYLTMSWLDFCVPEGFSILLFLL